METRRGQEPIGLLLTRVAKTVSRSFDAVLATRGGSLPTWLVLLSLTGEPHRSQRSIAAAVGVEGPTLTHHLNRMEDEGLVTRTRDPENRRVHQVALTETGHAAFQSLRGGVVEFDQRLRDGFTEDDLATLRQLLALLAANAAPPVAPGSEQTQTEEAP